MRENEEFLLESELFVSVFLKKQKSKRKKSDCIYLGCTTLILKIASLS